MAAAILALVLLGAAFPVTIPGAIRVPVLNAAVLSPPVLAAAAPMKAPDSLQAAPVLLTVVAPSVTEEALLVAADSTADALDAMTLAQRIASVPVDVATTREPVAVPRFYRWEVQEGENLTAIADRFGIGVDYITWNNADVRDDPDSLAIGSKLQIPAIEGILHDVGVGETLTEIALRYDADIEDIMAFKANGLADPNQLRVASQILVVGGRFLPPVAASLRPGVGADPDAPLFAWPVKARGLTSYFGATHPLGIDIGLLYEPLYASQSGTVTRVVRGIYSYGYYVDIDHGWGWVTRYAHLSRIYVTLGQHVEAGDEMGVTGNTGNSTGPHLHFEILRYGVPQNPLTFLE